MKLFGIIGAGGMGREVMPLAVRQPAHQMISQAEAEYAFVVEDHYLGDIRAVNGHRVLSLSEFMAAQASERFYTVAIGSGEARERISRSIPPSIATPFDVRTGSFEEGSANDIGEGAVFCNFTVVTSNTKIGRFFQCNMGSTIGHDCVIGDYVTLAPGARVNGRVTIEDHAFIGSGAIIVDGTKKPIVIGKGAVIGMGSVILDSVPAGATVFGNPSRVYARAS